MVSEMVQPKNNGLKNGLWMTPPKIDGPTNGLWTTLLKFDGPSNGHWMTRCKTNGLGNGPKIFQQCSRNCLKMDQTWTKNGPDKN